MPALVESMAQHLGRLPLPRSGTQACGLVEISGLEFLVDPDVSFL